MSIYTRQKSESILRSMVELCCEVEMLRCFIEFHFLMQEMGLIKSLFAKGRKSKKQNSKTHNQQQFEFFKGF